MIAKRSSRWETWRRALAGAALLAVATAWAGPGRTETFSGPLAPAGWTLIEGDETGAVVAEGRLQLALSGERPTLLRHRWYPLRSLAERPAPGNFRARVRLERNPAAAPFGFALVDAGDWSLRIDYDPAGSRARLVRTAAGRSEAVDWTAVPAAGPEVELAFVRRGNRIDAQAGMPGGLLPVGYWAGEPAAILDFTLQVQPGPKGGEKAAPQRVVALTIEPLPREPLYFEVERRAGQPLPGDGALSEQDRKFSGEHRGGYLWPHGEEAKLAVRVANVAASSQTGELVVSTVDWQETPVGTQRFPVTLAAGEERTVEVPLPAARLGYFVAHLSLLSAKGEPLDAPQAVGYGITAAPRPEETGLHNPVGIHAAPLALTGAKWVRFWDQGTRAVHWSGIEPEKGRWDWAGLDAYVQRTAEAGLASPVVVLAMTPEWASSEPQTPTYRGRGAFAPPKNLEEWAEYCRRMAGRYKGRVRYYEIWNEPNNNHLADRGFFFHGPVERYLALVRAAYEAIKAVDPEAQVLAPSGTGNFFPFLERFLELGGGRYCDIVSIHTYTTPFPPEIGYAFNQEKSYLSRVTRVRELLKKHGLEKPIWNTEIGYHGGLALSIAGVPIRQDQIAAEALPGHWPNWKDRWSFRPVDPRRSTAFFVRFLILTPVYGVERVFIHHRLMDSAAGDGSPLMPAPAVGWFSHLLGDATYVRSHDWNPAVQAHEFRRADGRSVIAVWRVENESLRMNAPDDRRLGKDIDSAPVEGIAEQAPVAALAGSAPPRATYFDPARRVPVGLRLSARPAGAFDLWGNPLPDNPIWEIGEAPLYLIYDTPPAGLRAEVIQGSVASATVPALRSEAGRLVAGPGLPSPPRTVRELLPSLVPLSLAKPGSAEAGEASAWRFGLTGRPARARLLLAVRSGKTHYEVRLDGRAVPARPWPAWPEREKRRGSNWVENEVILITDPVALRADGEFTVTASRNDGRLYQAWLWPQEAAP